MPRMTKTSLEDRVSKLPSRNKNVSKKKPPKLQLSQPRKRPSTNSTNVEEMRMMKTWTEVKVVKDPSPTAMHQALELRVNRDQE
jgi:hypothetical protein